MKKQELLATRIVSSGLPATRPALLLENGIPFKERDFMSPPTFGWDYIPTVELCWMRTAQ
jgi:hypothetical protein